MDPLSTITQRKADDEFIPVVLITAYKVVTFNISLGGQNPTKSLIHCTIKTTMLPCGAR